MSNLLYKAPNYGVGTYCIEVPYVCWSESFGENEPDSNKVATLLHEYVHFLQDTTTYYGALYRKEIYDGNVNRDIKGGSPQDISYALPSSFFDCDGIFMYGEVIIGSLLIKETMALLAQQYVFRDERVSLPIGPDYNLLINEIAARVPFLKKRRLLMFALLDVTLMSDNPAKSLYNLVRGLKDTIPNEFNNSSEKDLIDEWYSLCERTIAQELGYNSIPDLKLEGDYWIAKVEDNSLVVKEKSPELLEKVNSVLRDQYINNLSNIRTNDHSIISKTLISFKENKTMKTFYDVFGMPVIICSDRRVPNLTNFSKF